MFTTSIQQLMQLKYFSDSTSCMTNQQAPSPRPLYYRTNKPLQLDFHLYCGQINPASYRYHLNIYSNIKAHWTLDTEHWTLDTRHWTLDTGHSTLDTLNPKCKNISTPQSSLPTNIHSKFWKKRYSVLGSYSTSFQRKKHPEFTRPH